MAPARKVARDRELDLDEEAAPSSAARKRLRGAAETSLIALRSLVLIALLLGSIVGRYQEYWLALWEYLFSCVILFEFSISACLF